MTQIASIRAKPDIVIPARPRSDIAISSDYARFLMHESTGTDTELVDSQGIFGTLVMNNAGDWTTKPGWLTASTASGGSMELITSPSAAQKALMRTDTLSGILLISCFVDMPATITNDTIISYGKPSSGNNNSYELIIAATTGKATLATRGPASEQENALGTSDLQGAGETHVAGFIDTVNNECQIWVNGVSEGNNSITPHDGLPTIDRIGILGKVNGASGEAEFGEGDTGAPAITELTIIRFESDVSASMAAIIQGLAANRADLPWEIDGL